MFPKKVDAVYCGHRTSEPEKSARMALSTWPFGDGGGCPGQVAAGRQCAVSLFIFILEMCSDQFGLINKKVNRGHIHISTAILWSLLGPVPLGEGGRWHSELCHSETAG